MMEVWMPRIIGGAILLSYGLLLRWIWQLKTNEMHGLVEDIAETKVVLIASITSLKSEVTASIASLKIDLTERIGKMEKSFDEMLIRQDDIARSEIGKIHNRLDEHINELHVKS